MRAALPNALARALRGFFADHLPRVRGASPHTVHSYRDAFTLLLRFLAERHDRPVILLDFDELSPDSVLAFLDHLEVCRGNSPRTRNTRLAAIHAFARYAAAGEPQHLERCQQLLAIPFKRVNVPVVEYLEAEEVRALLDATDPSTSSGRRDHAILLTLFNTGARVQELVDIRPCDLHLERPLQVRLFGKGRKERFCPLWRQTAEALKVLMEENRVDRDSNTPLFRNQRGRPLSRFGVRYIMRKHARLAEANAPTLKTKRVHSHVMRHTAAVHLLQAGVDMVTISHWLGHASIETTNRYAAVDLETKREAIAKAGPLGGEPVCVEWRRDPSILQWLESL
ncbi:MAG: site-specific integrase [Alphaproteobacteria bacterium]|nr:site-specific integrase [Alphaproteobacteria bacterium]MCB9794818.1 site-specific integrase [Alphaproteobacteria bacterium]